MIRGFRSALMRGIIASPKVPAFSPVAKWPLNGSLADDVGSLDLTSTDATASYTAWPSGKQLINCSTSRAFVRSSYDASLALLGDMTAMCLVYPTSVTAGAYGSILISMSGILTDASQENALYWLNLESTGLLRYYAEFSNGADVDFTSATGVVPFSTLSHVGFTRASNVVRLYVNGAVVATSGTLTAPTAGVNARFGVGGYGHSSFTTRRLVGNMGDVQIVGSALTDAQMYAVAQASLASAA